jgi:vacuolar-type H+-ATPase subunit H
MIKGKKVTEIKAKADKIIDENRNAASQLFTKLEDKADKAEVEMLKNHPLKQQITQSKEILDLTQKIIDDSYDIKDEAA